MSRTYNGLWRVLIVWDSGHAWSDPSSYEFCEILCAGYAHGQPFEGHRVDHARIVSYAS